MKRHLNTSYRLVWNHITGTLVVASELARSRENALVWRLRCLCCCHISPGTGC